MNTKNDEIFIEYIKHHTPSFQKTKNETDFIFCSKMECDDCPVVKMCNTSNLTRAPTISAKKYKETLKDNPEYGI